MYDVNTLSLWLGVGVALILGGIQISRWRHPLVIGGLIAAGALCIFAAVIAPLLSATLPALSGFMSAAAKSPSSWFTLFMFVAALVTFGARSRPNLRREPRNIAAHVDERAAATDSANAAIPPLTAGVVAQELRASITDLETRLAERIQGIQSLARGSEKLVSDLQGRMKLAEHDLTQLFYLAINISTREYLSGLIAGAPDGSIPRSGDADYRDDCLTTIEAWIRRITHEFLGTDRGASAESVLQAAGGEAEREATSDVQQPEKLGGMNPFLHRRYLIAEKSRDWLVQFLESERYKIDGKISAQRDDLIARSNHKS